MCGIAGYVSNHFYGTDVIQKMRDSLIKRGPDGYGTYLDEMFGRQIDLAHRRLSVRDLSENGVQPMVSKD
jgi:asparagine synthase (glutamine-hydrolysing)